MSDDDEPDLGCGCVAMLFFFAVAAATCGLLGIACKFMVHAWSWL